MDTPNATVLILAPMKTATLYFDDYFIGLEALTYPRNLISLGILEGDSSCCCSGLSPANDGVRPKTVVLKRINGAI